jgi:hypothetical protein
MTFNAIPLRSICASLVALLAACMPLGAITTTTQTRATPYASPGAELHMGVSHGAWTSELLGVPGDEVFRAFPVAQLGGGVEVWTDERSSAGVGLAISDTHWDPSLRYRRFLDERRDLSLGVAAWGTRIIDANTSEEPRFQGGRIGGEAVVEYRFAHLDLGEDHPFTMISLSAIGGASLSAVTVRGRWCSNAAQEFVTCEDLNPDVERPFRHDKRIFFALPSAHAGLAVDLLDRFRWFPGIRLATTFGGHVRPLVAPDGRGRMAVGELSFGAIVQLRYGLPLNP